MADNVVIYWVPKAGTIYAANLLTRTYVGISSMERLGAAQRALDRAGIPHASWGPNEPATMEEFGVEIRNASALDGFLNNVLAQATSASAHAINAEVHAGEARRMLGVLLGWNAPQDGSNEWLALAALRTYLLSAIVDSDTGYWYAVGPGVFWHLQDMVQVNTLRKARILSDRQDSLTHDEVVMVQELMQRPIGAVAPIPPPKTHTVAAGDTFNAIAAKYGITPDALAAANPTVTDRSKLNILQVLNLPK